MAEKVLKRFCREKECVVILVQIVHNNYPTIGSMEGYFVHCLFFFVFFVRLRISQRRKKARGVKFCTRVGLLPGQVFSPFGEHWLAESHGVGITFRDVCGH